MIKEKVINNPKLLGVGAINPLRAESVSNFGIFLNFNFPKNTFKYSKSHSQDTSRKIKPVKYHLF